MMAKRDTTPAGHDPRPAPGRGRPRDTAVDEALLAAAERQLRELGYARMSLRSIADEAGTTIPSLRRRYADKSALATAVVDSLRVEPMTVPSVEPRDQALAVLENFGSNLRRPRSMALLGTLLAEESATPQLLGRFRTRLSTPRRDALRKSLEAGIAAGGLPPHIDPDIAANLLIGSFYARYVSDGKIPRAWPSQVLAQIWPEP